MAELSEKSLPKDHSMIGDETNNNNESSVDEAATTTDESFSGLAGELTDLMAELRDL